MPTKTKEGLIVKGGRAFIENLKNRFSSGARDYAKYKIQKQKGTYKDPAAGLTPTKPQPYTYDSQKYKTKPEVPSSSKEPSTPKTKNQERDIKPPASAIKERGIQLSATNIKPFSNGTLTAGDNKVSVSNENKKKLDKLQKISDRVDRRQDRKDNRAERLAARKDITFDEAKNLQESRKLARKDFLRSFASNLAGVEMGKQGGNFNTKDIDFFNNQNAKSDAAQAQETEIENNEEMYKSKLSAKSKTNDSLGDVGFSNINN